MLIEIRICVESEVQAPKELAHGLNGRIAAHGQPFQLFAGQFGGVANGRG